MCDILVYHLYVVVYPTGPLGKLVVQRPSLNELPLCDYSFRLFFELLGVRNIVKLLTCILLEHQVLVKSSGELEVEWLVRL